MSINTIINRQYAIANNQADPIDLPKQRIYAMCNLRGGIGKTTLSFNLSYLVDSLLAVDTCPQGNLSFFYDNNTPILFFLKILIFFFLRNYIFLKPRSFSQP